MTTEQNTANALETNTQNNTSEAPFVITISRQLGSGGSQIAHALAERFGVAYYDKELLSQAALNTGLGHNVFDRTEKRKGFMRHVFGAVQPFIGGGDFYGPQLSDENIFKLQSGVIQKVAAERSCVFVGRAADHILAQHPRKVSIFITANNDERIRRVMDMKKVDYRNATHLIEDSDEERSGYYNFHAPGTWGSADNYDFCINVSSIGIDSAIDFITDFVRFKLGVTPTAQDEEQLPVMF